VFFSGSMSHLNLNAVIVCVLLALGVIAPRFGDRFFRRFESWASGFSRRKKLVVWTSALATILIRVSLLPWLPVPIPEIHDEYSYLLEGDTFAHGRLANPPHPMSLFFETFHVLQHPTYASQYPPAQGAVLAFGEILGHPWLGVLLSMALMTAAVVWMLQAWLPPQWALLGGLFVLIRLDTFSYWISSYWGGAVAATGGALVLGGYRRLIHSHLPLDAFALGIGAALLACSRPFEGFIFCVPIAIALLVRLLSERSSPQHSRARILSPVAVTLALAILFLGYYNWRVTGNAITFPESLTQRTYENQPLFAWQKPRPQIQYSNPQFTAFHAMQRTRYDGSFSKWMTRSWDRLGSWRYFPGSALMLPFITLPWTFRDRRIRLLWIISFCCTLGLLAVVYFEYHYAAPLTAVVMVLVVQAVRHLRQWTWGRRPIGIGLSRAIVLAAIVNVAILTSATARHPSVQPWIFSRAQMIAQLNKLPGYHLVIVRYSPQHPPYAEWVYNRADIDHAKIVWAREIPGVNIQPLLDYFHGRTVWLVEADASPPRLSPYQR